LAAELVARDKNRMLVLLKVAASEPLPVAQPTPSIDWRVGQSAVALGRTFQADQVGVSVGIVSALNRMHGRVIQTDASTSAANYGGPLVDLHGRVLGVLVPMAPQGGGASAAPNELAGAEFYDSGIGFAVPLEHTLKMLKRWKQGADLLPGKLGIGLTKGDPHVTPPRLTAVWPSSPAAKADWQPGDLIIAVNEQPVTTQSELHFQITPRYAGDAISVTLKRGTAELTTRVTLAKELASYRHPFLGILPERQKKAGAQVRRVWPGSPAAAAGIKPGDQIVQVDQTSIDSMVQLHATLTGFHPEKNVTLKIQRATEQQEIVATLSTLPEEILSAEDLSLPAVPHQIEDERQTTKLKKLSLPEFAQEAAYLLPDAPQDQSLGLLLWLGDGNPEHDQALLDTWQTNCQQDGLILLIAPPATAPTWKADDLAYLRQLARVARQRFPVDRQRIVVAGQGKAGQLAYSLALARRSSFRGVISINAPLPRTLKLPATSPSKRLAILSVKARSYNLGLLIRRDVSQLRQKGYPTSQIEYQARTTDESGMDAGVHGRLRRWIDGLDHL